MCFVCLCTLVGKAWWTYTQSIVKERQGNAKNVWFCQINNKIDILLIIICAYKRSGHNIDNLLNEFIMAKNKINKLLSFNKCTNSHFYFFFIHYIVIPSSLAKCPNRYSQRITNRTLFISFLFFKGSENTDELPHFK